MIKITAKFASADNADFALGDLKAGVLLEQVSMRCYKNYYDGSPYPISPEYLEPSHTQYLEGMPHVLSNGPLFNEYFEPEYRREATLRFFTRVQDVDKAQSILLKHGGYDIKSEK